MASWHNLQGIAVAGVLAIVPACEPAQVAVTAPVPRPANIEPVVAPRSAASLAVQRHFTRLENELLTQGLLRSDGGGPDTRFSRNDIVENFIRIALHDEYVLSNGRLVERQSPTRLHRWEDPVRFGVHFGPSVPLTQREKDRSDIRHFARRLARISGHPISSTQGDANFLVLILNEDERSTFVPQLRQLMPAFSEADAKTILTMPRSTLCHVFAVDPGDTGAYKRAVAVIRAEHPDVIRLSCIHEELTQGLGLANDSRHARPSIFNDDEEFARLTTHDEYLLRILYDQRLHPGIEQDAARPIVEEIAQELVGAPT